MIDTEGIKQALLNAEPIDPGTVAVLVEQVDRLTLHVRATEELLTEWDNDEWDTTPRPRDFPRWSE